MSVAALVGVVVVLGVVDVLMLVLLSLVLVDMDVPIFCMATHFIFTSFFLSCITSNPLFGYKSLFALYFEENRQFYEGGSSPIVEINPHLRISLRLNSAELMNEYEKNLYY
jgi:hypothetical protein